MNDLCYSVWFLSFDKKNDIAKLFDNVQCEDKLINFSYNKYINVCLNFTLRHWTFKISDIVCIKNYIFVPYKNFKQLSVHRDL